MWVWDGENPCSLFSSWGIIVSFVVFQCHWWSTTKACLCDSYILVVACDARINNAGTNAYMFEYLMDSADEDIIDIVQTNLLGVMLGCKEVCFWRRLMAHKPAAGLQY